MKVAKILIANDDLNIFLAAFVTADAPHNCSCYRCEHQHSLVCIVHYMFSLLLLLLRVLIDGGLAVLGNTLILHLQQLDWYACLCGCRGSELQYNIYQHILM